MAVPGRVEAILGDEAVVASVPIGDDGGLFITASRTIIYRESTLLRDESVETYPNDAERLSVSEGRRKSRLTFGYRDGSERTLTIPSDLLEAVIPAVLEGVLFASGVLEADERVIRTDRFNELTLVVTDDRVVKHVGRAVWGRDFDVIPYESLTDLRTEEGSVATQLVFALVDGRERIKVPHRAARTLVDDLEAAVCDYHQVDSIDTLRERFAKEGDARTSAEPTFVEDLDPLTPTITTGGQTATEEVEAGAREVADDPGPDLLAQLEELRETVARHEELLERHGELLERLEAHLDRED